MRQKAIPGFDSADGDMQVGFLISPTRMGSLVIMSSTSKYVVLVTVDDFCHQPLTKLADCLGRWLSRQR